MRAWHGAVCVRAVSLAVGMEVGGGSCKKAFTHPLMSRRVRQHFHVLCCMWGDSEKRTGCTRAIGLQLCALEAQSLGCWCDHLAALIQTLSCWCEPESTSCWHACTEAHLGAAPGCKSSVGHGCVGCRFQKLRKKAGVTPLEPVEFFYGAHTRPS